MKNPNKTASACLAIFLGSCGAHRLYHGNVGAFVAQLLVVGLLSWTLIVPIIAAIIGVVEGIMYAVESDEKWAMRFASAD